mmetsp:Transcript_104495/g.265247  ORF Transcript_104495/g.265247 Transcript_104495/m.265247 type:complete len:266 (-) Transcript_104495:1646-2443(-)
MRTGPRQERCCGTLRNSVERPGWKNRFDVRPTGPLALQLSGCHPMHAPQSDSASLSFSIFRGEAADFQLPGGPVEPLQNLFRSPRLVLVLVDLVFFVGIAGAELAKLYDRIHIRLQEVRHRISVVQAGVDDPVHSGLEAVCSPSTHHVTQVDDKSVLDRNGMDPLAILIIQHLQSADEVLLKQGKQAVVCMLANADLCVEVFDWPIMQQPVGGDGRCQILLEEFPRLPQDQRHQQKEMLGQVEHCLRVLLQGRSKSGKLLLLGQP